MGLVRAQLTSIWTRLGSGGTFPFRAAARAARQELQCLRVCLSQPQIHTNTFLAPVPAVLGTPLVPMGAASTSATISLLPGACSPRTSTSGLAGPHGATRVHLIRGASLLTAQRRTGLVCNSCREQQGHTVKYNHFFIRTISWGVFFFFFFSPLFPSVTLL